MIDEEAFHAFISGLQPHLQEHVGAHVQGDLEGRHRHGPMSGGLSWWRRGQDVRQRTQKVKSQKKGNVAQVEGSSSGRDCPSGPGREKAAKEGQG